jgi:hypothetical protein
MCVCVPVTAILRLCRNDSQVNNRLVVRLSKEGGEEELFWKDVVAGDLIKVSEGRVHVTDVISAALEGAEALQWC